MQTLFYSDKNYIRHSIVKERKKEREKERDIVCNFKAEREKVGEA